MKEHSYWERLEILQIKSLQRRREQLILLLVWKIKNGFTPNVVDLEFFENPRNQNVNAVLKPMPRVGGKFFNML